MKRILYMMLVLPLLLSALASPTYASSQPDGKGNILACLPEGHWLRIYQLDRDDTWDRIDGSFGAVSANGFIKIDGLEVDGSHWRDGHPYKVELVRPGEVVVDTVGADQRFRVYTNTDNWSFWGNCASGDVPVVAPSGSPAVEVTEDPAVEVAESPASVPEIVLIPPDGTQLTLGDGTQIRHPIFNDVPEPTDNEWVHVRSGTPIYKMSGDADGMSIDMDLSFLVKQGTPVEIIVEDVTSSPFKTVIHDTAPHLENGMWTGAAASDQVGRTSTPWMYEPGTSLLIYRITMRMASGEQIVFYQAASFEYPVKKLILDNLGES